MTELTKEANTPSRNKKSQQRRKPMFLTISRSKSSTVIINTDQIASVERKLLDDDDDGSHAIVLIMSHGKRLVVSLRNDRPTNNPYAKLTDFIVDKLENVA